MGKFSENLCRNKYADSNYLAVHYSTCSEAKGRTVTADRVFRRDADKYLNGSLEEGTVWQSI